jgi:hypothetical protein
MKALEQMSRDGSPAREFMEDCEYDPEKFKDFLLKHKLKKEVHYLFEYPFDDLPLKINDESINGYLMFRFTIGK